MVKAVQVYDGNGVKHEYRPTQSTPPRDYLGHLDIFGEDNGSKTHVGGHVNLTTFNHLKGFFTIVMDAASLSRYIKDKSISFNPDDKYAKMKFIMENVGTFDGCFVIDYQEREAIMKDGSMVITCKMSYDRYTIKAP